MNSNDPKKMIEAADLFNRTLRKLIVSDQGIHAETIVAAAARMAGTLLFRSFPPEFGHLQPGVVIVTDEGNAQGPMLVRTLFATLRQLGHDDIDERGLGGARETTALSRLSLAETQQILEPWYRKVKDVCGLSFRETAGAAAMTTALQIHECRPILGIHSGCAIAVHGMVEAVKTVPQELTAGS